MAKLREYSSGDYAMSKLREYSSVATGNGNYPSFVPFRVGQRVCCVSWNKGQPFLKVGTVTKATRSTYYVDSQRAAGWYANGRDAINEEYQWLFRMWSIWNRGDPEAWTLHDNVRCVCRLRRLERRLFRRKLLG